MKDGRTALICWRWANLEGYLEVVQLLLDEGALIEQEENKDRGIAREGKGWDQG